MKIVDLIVELQNKESNEEINNYLGLICKNADLLFINDLDLGLLIITLAIKFNNPVFLNHLKNSLIISNLYECNYKDIIFKNIEKEIDNFEIIEKLKSTLHEFSKEDYEILSNHELLNDVDLKAFIDKHESTIKSVVIKYKGNDFYSFALTQTKFKLIDEIIVVNNSEDAVKDLKLIITSTPSYLVFNEINIPLLNPKSAISITDFYVTPKLESLLKLQEKIVGNLTIRIIKDDSTISFFNTTLNYYSYDTWFENLISGSSALFVTPNDIAVKEIVGYTAQEMERLTDTTILDDYQSQDKNIIANQVKALYNALHHYGISYLTVPASFETVGQKVRLPHDTIMYKQGNCLDVSLLFASCLESIGLNPFLITLPGHAMVGVFLEEKNFKTTVYDDVPKLLEMDADENNEILLIEATCVCTHSTSNFEEACAEGRRKVSECLKATSFSAIDIKRARSQGYLPLPINYDNFNRTNVDYETLDLNKTRLSRRDYSFKGDKIELTDTQINKFDLWEKKLLDLSKRNPLINYKINGKGLQLNIYNLNSVYAAFKNKAGQYFLSFGEEYKSDIFELPPVSIEKYNLIEKDFNAKRIEILLRNPNQKTSLKYFERERRKSFEETGSNILYLGIGFVQYYDSNKNNNPLYAPVILIPIDLKRHSRDNYSISGREEPPFLNISIFEYFFQEYGCDFSDLLSAPLFDSDTVDIDVVLNTVSEKLRVIGNTSIIRSVCLSTFNFSKAVMWSDIKYRRKDLIQNKIIKSIIEKRYIKDEIDNQHSIDLNKYDPSNIAIPLSADSSQIEAIIDCERGKNFILQGPPGTGKSQTITNMIVNSIYHNKTVLFVAEKMAALEVVQRRLNELCLGDFVLEAHSIKADKTSLMQQFEKRVKLGFTSSNNEEFVEYSNKLKEERKELNKVINYLHTKRGYLFSFYDAFVNFLDLRNIEESINIPEKYIKILSLSEFQNDCIQIERLDSSIKTMNGYKDNEFIFYRNSRYEIGRSKIEFLKNINEYKIVLENLNTLYSSLIIDNHIKDQHSFEFENLLFELLTDTSINEIFYNMLDLDLDSLDIQVKSIIELATRFQTYIKDLTTDFDLKIVNEAFQDDFVLYKESFLFNSIKRKITQSKLRKKLKFYYKKKGSFKIDLGAIYSNLTVFNQTRNKLEDVIGKYLSTFEDFEKEDVLHFNFKEFERRYELTKSLINKYEKIIGIENLKIIYSHFFDLKHKKDLLNSLVEIQSLETELKSKGFDFSYRVKNKIDFNSLSYYINKAIKNADYLNNWCYLIGLLEQLNKNNLGFISDFVENNDYKNDLELIYKKSLYLYIVTKSIEETDGISFNSNEMETHINYYKEIINKFKELTIKETASKISIKMPSINENSPLSSEQGILNKAIKNRCRGKSIRQLFFEIKNIIPRVFPVFLMSPISSAQYLSPDMPKFDIVIFDEASQMPTSEAIGAISRGHSLIVVGDSKQLPPTSFFKMKGDETDIDLDDQESILDDCEVIGLPTKRLNWHYRSKHESLIRFSNFKFYNNSLVTFPSPNDLISKITLINTKGIYGDKGTTNEIEAEAVVKEIARRLKNPYLRQKSIGVITFSTQQQDMIEDLLNDFFARNRELEKINNESKEPIIIKNLENIQGDERDVILFSICYGPDKSGKMYFRFGPINNLGGEKRLNVAISRARYEMLVFTSFDPKEMHRMRTDSVGAIELYNFLKYAKDGSSQLIVKNGLSIEEKVGFEKYIAEELIKRGYKVKCNIGNSSFKINVGVINPENENEYILGILCDSYSYEDTKTTTDRNIIQPGVLTELGWNLLRVYSFDYYDNPVRIIENILEKINSILENPELYKRKELKKEQLNIVFDSHEALNKSFSKPYISFNKIDKIYGTFNDNIYNKKDIILEIMKLEAPISHDLLKLRFVNAIGATRATSNIQNDMAKALQMIGAKSNRDATNSKTFYWLADQNFHMDCYRVGGVKPRDVDDIPKEEIYIAIKEILLNNGSVNCEELKKCVANLFMIKTLSKTVDLTLRYTIDYYEQKGLLFIKDDKVNLVVDSNNNK